MTSRRRGDGDQPPRPGSPEIHDDPLLRPASNAGWDDEHPSPPRAPDGTATSGTAAASIENPPSTTSATPPSTTSATTPSTASATTPSTTSATTPTSTSTAPTRATPPSTTGATPPSTTGATPSRSASAASWTPAGEEPLLPATYHENDLRSAVGASPLSEPLAATSRKRRAPASDRHDDDEAPRGPRNRKMIAVAALSITAGLAVAALVFLGRMNSDRYLLTCEAERAVAEQGRNFPPWGTHALAGEAWRPLKITPETRCQPHETDDPLDLERLYLSMILDQATALLTAHEVTKLDDAEALLKQALLLTRPPEHEPEQLTNERNERHTEIERMLGDVTSGRASATLHDAEAVLMDAAKQFDSAAAQHPRHASDAAAWAAYARKLAQELHAGPAGAAPSASPPAASPASSTVPATEQPNVPAGVALPVEPGKGSADAPLVTPVAPVAPVPPAPADAGVPTGGVLL